MAFGDVDITEGAGTPVGTDLISGRHFQRMKLVDGTEAGTDGIPGSLARGLTVDPRHFRYDQVQNSAGLTNAAYAVGEVLGTGWTFTNAARAAAGAGRLNGITVTDKNDLITCVQLWFASASITFGSDNAVPSISDADSEKLLPGSGIVITLTDLGGVKFGAVDTMDIPYVCDATSLFVYGTTPIALASGWATATDLRIRLFATLD